MLDDKRLFDAVAHLLWRDVDDRTAAVELLDFLELTHDLFLAHGIDRAVPDLLAINVDRPKGLPAAILGLYRSAIGSCRQCLIANHL